MSSIFLLIFFLFFFLYNLYASFLFCLYNSLFCVVFLFNNLILASFVSSPMLIHPSSHQSSFLFLLSCPRTSCAVSDIHFLIWLHSCSISEDTFCLINLVVISCLNFWLIIASSSFSLFHFVLSLYLSYMFIILLTHLIFTKKWSESEFGARILLTSVIVCILLLLTKTWSVRFTLLVPGITPCSFVDFLMLELCTDNNQIVHLNKWDKLFLFSTLLPTLPPLSLSLYVCVCVYIYIYIYSALGNFRQLCYMQERKH